MTEALLPHADSGSVVNAFGFSIGVYGGIESAGFLTVYDINL